MREIIWLNSEFQSMLDITEKVAWVQKSKIDEEDPERLAKI